MIKVRNLTKYYGERLAVDKINFDIGKGEIVGLLGPNAAGKTTTMRMLTGFMMLTLLALVFFLRSKAHETAGQTGGQPGPSGVAE